MVGQQAFRFGIPPIFGDYVLYLVTSWWISQTFGAKPHSLRYDIGLVNYPPHLKQKNRCLEDDALSFWRFGGRPIFRSKPRCLGFREGWYSHNYRVHHPGWLLTSLDCEFELLKTDSQVPNLGAHWPSLYMRNLIEVCSGSFLYF